MGVMYYAEYFHLFERSRNEFIRSLGESYADVEKKGVILPVRDAQCRFRSPARYDDLILVRIGLAEIGRASLKFAYEILNADRTKTLATGSTTHAVVGPDLRPTPIPAWFRDLLNNRRA